MGRRSLHVQGSLAYEKPDRRHGRAFVMAPRWCHEQSSTPSRVSELDRLNQRLSPDTYAAIDAARADRPGSVSPNTWNAEAVQEKLARSREAGVAPPRDALRHA